MSTTNTVAGMIDSIDASDVIRRIAWMCWNLGDMSQQRFQHPCS